MSVCLCPSVSVCLSAVLPLWGVRGKPRGWAPSPCPCVPPLIAQGMLRNHRGSLLAPSPLRASPQHQNPPGGVLRLP